MINLTIMLARTFVFSLCSSHALSGPSAQQVADFEKETDIINEHSNYLEQFINVYECYLFDDEPKSMIMSRIVQRIADIDDCFPFLNLVVCKPFPNIKNDYDLIGKDRFLEIYSTRITAECFFLHFYKKAKDLFALPKIILGSFNIGSVLKIYDQGDKEFSDVISRVTKIDKEQFIAEKKPIGATIFKRFSYDPRRGVICNSLGINIRLFSGTCAFLMNPSNENFGDITVISAFIIRKKHGIDLFEVLSMEVFQNQIMEVFADYMLSEGYLMFPEGRKVFEQRRLLNDLLRLNGSSVEQRLFRELENKQNIICEKGFYLKG